MNKVLQGLITIEVGQRNLIIQRLVFGIRRNINFGKYWDSTLQQRVESCVFVMGSKTV